VEGLDEVLAGRAAAGDMEAFESLVNRHRLGVYRLARSITGNHDDADDAAQETFVRVFRALETYDPTRPFKAWLKRITYNTSLNILRSSRARSSRTVEGDPPDLPDPSPGADQELEAGQTASGVQKALDALPADLRATLLLRAVEGMTYRDIAGATGVRVGTVMSRLSRARRRITESLENPGAGGKRSAEK